ncbi:hypothetical protein DFH06DRAFT_1145540, partial [Mycena polygramma]
MEMSPVWCKSAVKPQLRFATWNGTSLQQIFLKRHRRALRYSHHASAISSFLLHAVPLSWDGREFSSLGSLWGGVHLLPPNIGPTEERDLCTVDAIFDATPTAGWNSLDVGPILVLRTLNFEDNLKRWLKQRLGVVERHRGASRTDSGGSAREPVSLPCGQHVPRLPPPGLTNAIRKQTQIDRFDGSRFDVRPRTIEISPVLKLP